MQPTLVPLLRVQRELYALPRGMERFREYIRTMTDGETGDLAPPLAAMNSRVCARRADRYRSHGETVNTLPGGNPAMTRASLAVLALFLSVPVSAQGPLPAASAFERLKAMEGEWIDVTGAFGAKGAVVATYKVTGGGHTVIETFPVNTPHEMTTVYHRDGSHLVLTHYCSGGTQPRMRAKETTGNVLEFAYDGGTNIDAAKTSHMHNVRWEFVSKDEIKADWQNWSGGRPDHVGAMHIARKK